MSEEELKALFLLARIVVLDYHKIPNEYWPDTASYSDLRESSPWWLVTTPVGVIKIGWRKRVIEIDWYATKYRVGEGLHFKDRPNDLIADVTADDVTKGASYVHAWTYGKAVDYLSTIHLRLKQVHIAYKAED